MDREQRNALARAVVEARRLLEKELSEQLEGVYNILPDGTILDEAPGDPVTRARLLELIGHYRSSGASAVEARRRAVRENAFTILNRFAALKLAERRGIVRECVSQGLGSEGIRELAGIAPGLRGSFEDGGYRLLLEAMMDEISLSLKVLFDRRDPVGLLWPRARALEELLSVLNAAELADRWISDETIGWIYQYFNADDVREMREGSSAPRDGRELAVRNQFFTPRYVVEFLTDNTLGRLWYEMRKGDTRLKEQCQYMAWRATDVFLTGGQQLRDQQLAGVSEVSSKIPQAYVRDRPKRDPRDLRILDPAVGSGHFLLYSFDLLLAIYEEAWQDGSTPPFAGTGRRLRDDYPTLEAFRSAVPGLILRHNLHGIEIDPRCAQIAALALWLRAQRAWSELGVGMETRPSVQAAHLVTAEPLPSKGDVAQEFARTLEPAVLGDLFRAIVDEMKLVGDLGALLKVEVSIAQLLAQAKEKAKLGGLFDGPADDRYWDRVEERLLESLHSFAKDSPSWVGAVRRDLFAGDATRGVALIDLLRTKFDVVLMNPPYGSATAGADGYLREVYPETRVDLFAVFCERMLELLDDGGLLGALTPRDGFFKKTLGGWRLLMLRNALSLVADLGLGVLDGATVRTAAYVVERSRQGRRCEFYDVVGRDDREKLLLDLIRAGSPSAAVDPQEFSALPLSRFLYWFPNSLWSLYREGRPLENRSCTPRYGLTTLDDERFARLFVEVAPNELGPDRSWAFMSKGGEEIAFGGVSSAVVLWRDRGAEMAEVNRSANGQVAQTRRASRYYFRPALSYPNRSVTFSCRWNPANYCFSVRGPAIIPISAPLDYLLGFFNSRLVRALVEMQTASQTYTSGVLKQLPWVQPDGNRSAMVAEAARRIFQLSRRYAARRELDPFFTSPMGPLPPNTSFLDLARQLDNEVHDTAAAVLEAQAVIDTAIAQLYGVSESDLAKCERVENDESDVLPPWTPVFDRRDFARSVVQYCVGCAYGRFDSSRALDSVQFPAYPALHDPAPLLQPGRLAAAESDSPERPMQPAADGLLVFDEGDPADVVSHVRRVIETLWPDSSASAEAEICSCLGLNSLREYFSSASNFFADHLASYSKHMRRAPIYWPLSTLTGSYAVWVYYPQLSPDTLYRIVSEHVDPKLIRVASRKAQLEGEAPRSANRRDSSVAREVAELVALQDELQVFRAELIRVAALPYRPDFNDGVQITAAPLWRLFQHRSWQGALKETYERLESGAYDWAHLAYAIWPERVKVKCKIDKSLAIAHGLEEVYEGDSVEAKPKKARRFRR